MSVRGTAAAQVCPTACAERSAVDRPLSLLVALQDNEKKQKRETKETAEELQECEMVFADF